MNKREMLKLLGAAKLLWPSWKDAPTTKSEWSLMADVWLTILTDLDVDLCFAALQVLAAEGRDFVPPAGVLRRQAVMLRARASGDLPPGVDEAWAEVTFAIRNQVGEARIWGHPCVAQTVAAIGWYELRTSTNQDAMRAHFRQFYTEAKERYERDLVLSGDMMDSIQRASLAELSHPSRTVVS